MGVTSSGGRVHGCPPEWEQGFMNITWVAGRGSRMSASAAITGVHRYHLGWREKAGDHVCHLRCGQRFMGVT